MAIFRSGPLIGAISGNLGGLCFVQTKAGPVIRKRNVRTKQTSNRQTLIRTAFSTNRARWRAITDNQRTAWRQSAASILLPNRLGVRRNLSGYQLYMKIATFANLTPGFPPRGAPDDPPLFHTAPLWTLSNFAITPAGVATIEVQEPIPSAIGSAAVFCARTFSSAPRKSWFDFRFVGGVVFVAGTIPINQWFDVIGAPSPGEQCWVQLWQTVDGLSYTAPQTLSTFAV